MLQGVARAEPVTTYDADYTIEYKGREAGHSEFSVSHDPAAGTYRFRSDSKLRGLVARIVAPKAVVEDSTFRIVKGHTKPESFHYEDGSRKGDDNFDIAFDWPTTATVTIDGNRREFPLEPGALDRGTAQVALVLAVASGSIPDGFGIIDDDGLDRYDLTELEPATANSALGVLKTRRFAWQRPGSSRQTIFWLAPDLRYVPIRIEQLKDGEPLTAFALEAVHFTD